MSLRHLNDEHWFTLLRASNTAGFMRSALCLLQYRSNLQIPTQLHVGHTAITFFSQLNRPTLHHIVYIFKSSMSEKGCIPARIPSNCKEISLRKGISYPSHTHSAVVNSNIDQEKWDESEEEEHHWRLNCHSCEGNQPSVFTALSER